MDFSRALLTQEFCQTPIIKHQHRSETRPWEVSYLAFNSGQPDRKVRRDTIKMRISAGEKLKAPVSVDCRINYKLWYPLVIQYVANAGQNVTVLLG